MKESTRQTFRILIMACLLETVPVAAAAPPPNIVVIFVDDMGYADIGAFGAKNYPTPNLDRMASEGMVLTDFHVASAICSASRAALLTGRYPERVGVLGAFGPGSKNGIRDSEVLLSEICKSRGYSTAIFGKWHLGDAPQYLPTRHGFDEWFGLPYSNDMWPLHPNLIGRPRDEALKVYPLLPLYENEKVIDADVTGEEQEKLTTQYTERAVAFIKRNKNQPFFLYVPHSMVHVPLFVSEKFAGKSGAGLFGDVMMEIDWSVGEILGALRDTGLDDNTLLLFTSDNGPWLSYGEHAGSAGPFREGKTTAFEGGCRVSCVARWPGKIPPASRCDELMTTMDVLPTVARLVGAHAPTDRVIDGRDIWPLLSAEQGAKSPHQAFYYYYHGQLHAVRDNRWKLHLPHDYLSLGGRPGGTGGMPAKYDQVKIGLELFDLENNPGESQDVADRYPEVLQRMLDIAEAARADLGDRLTNRLPRDAPKSGGVE